MTGLVVMRWWVLRASNGDDGELYKFKDDDGGKGDSVEHSLNSSTLALTFLSPGVRCFCRPGDAEVS